MSTSVAAQLGSVERIILLFACSRGERKAGDAPGSFGFHVRAKKERLILFIKKKKKKNNKMEESDFADNKGRNANTTFEERMTQDQWVKTNNRKKKKKKESHQGHSMPDGCFPIHVHLVGVNASHLVLLETLQAMNKRPCVAGMDAVPGHSHLA